MTSERWHENPINPDSDWRDADHYKVTLRRGRSRYTTYFSKGYDHNGQEPSLPEVLECLRSDYGSYRDHDSFEDFCAEFGYDSDSRSAERMFKAIQSQGARFERWLGAEALDDILNCEDE